MQGSDIAKAATPLVVLSLIALVACATTAPPTPGLDATLLQGLDETRYHRVDSAPLEQTYHVFVRLPEEYDASNQRFPTVYLLDGGTTFPLLAGYYRYLRLAEAIPPMILVGISYGTDDWRQGNARGRDFTAPSAEREHWGGARAFQDFFRAQLFPLIEASYRADPARRVVFGQSLGGQFAIHAALMARDLFWGHIASNPALHRNLELFIDSTAVVAADPRARLFVASGSDDDPQFRDPAVKWMEHWGAIEPRPFDLEMRTLPGHDHFSAAPASFRAGLQWLFAGPGHESR